MAALTAEGTDMGMRGGASQSTGVGNGAFYGGGMTGGRGWRVGVDMFILSSIWDMLSLRV